MLSPEETARAVSQQHDNEHAPLLADAPEDLADLAAVIVQGVVHQSGHLDVPGRTNLRS